MMIIFQIFICIIHGIFIRPQAVNFNTLNTIPVAITPPLPLILSFASTLGFGLLFSYNKRLILSGLGFSLFINAYVLQYYPVIHAFWSKTKVFTIV